MLFVAPVLTCLQRTKQDQLLEITIQCVSKHQLEWAYIPVVYIIVFIYAPLCIAFICGLASSQGGISRAQFTTGDFGIDKHLNVTSATEGTRLFRSFFSLPTVQQ
jgi:hypothetical protein